MTNRIVGISGSFSSGQDTLARYLRDEHGFVWVSTSDMVREESLKRHNSIERPQMYETATYLRKQFGGGALVERALKSYTEMKEKGRGLAVSGIRSIGEMNAITEAGGTMVYTDADPDLRYARMVARHRDKEADISEAAFLAREQAEWHTGDNDTDFNKRDIRAFVEEQGMILYNDNNTDEFFEQACKKLNL